MNDVLGSALAMGIVAGVLLVIVRGYRWMTHADEKDEKARRDWEQRCDENPGLRERAATATLKNPLGDLKWSDIKALETTDGSDQRQPPSEYEDLARRVEQKTSDIVRRGTAVASGAARGVSSSLPRWLKVVLLLAAVWVVLMIFAAL